MQKKEPTAFYNGAPLDLAPKSYDIVFYTIKPDSFEGKEILRITENRNVIISGDIYDAAKGFWECVRILAPSMFTVERDGKDE